MENTITNEQIEEVVDTIKETTEDSANKKIMEDAAEEAKKDHKGEVGTATVVTNPFTGKPMFVSDNEDTDFHLQSFEEMMEDESIVPMEIDESKVNINTNMVKNQIQAIFGNKQNLSMADLDKLVELANRVKNKEKFSYYSSMPQSVKDLINETIGVEMGSKMGSFIKEGRNYIAGSILQDIVNDATQEVAYNDLQKSIAAIKGEGAREMKKDSYWTDVKRYLMFGTLEKADKLREEGKTEQADRYEAVHDAFIESYMMTDMLDMYSRGKIRVRKIDVEKFKKTCNSFNFKYQNSTNVINDITQVIMILDRYADKRFDLDIIKEFICVFIKYTDIKNMKADDIVDHTFMYNWIFNIITLDMYNKEDEFSVEFHDQLISNINNFLSVITERKNKKE